MSPTLLGITMGIVFAARRPVLHVHIIGAPLRFPTTVLRKVTLIDLNSTKVSTWTEVTVFTTWPRRALCTWLQGAVSVAAKILPAPLRAATVAFFSLIQHSIATMLDRWYFLGPVGQAVQVPCQDKFCMSVNAAVAELVRVCLVRMHDTGFVSSTNTVGFVVLKPHVMTQLMGHGP